MNSDDNFCPHGFADKDRCAQCRAERLESAIRKAIKWCDLQIKYPGCEPGPKSLKEVLVRAISFHDVSSEP